jgi:hypothetical protein
VTLQAVGIFILLDRMHTAVDRAGQTMGGLFALGFGIVFGWLAWSVVSIRRLLATGDAVATGIVTETSTSKSSWRASYEFPSPIGPHRGRVAIQSLIVVKSFGFRPQPGDTVFVVYDSRSPWRNAAWGFGLPPGQRRELHWSDRLF